MKNLVLIKVGGSLITDKAKPFTTREDMMRSIAASIRAAYEKFPESAFLIGNGAGSFGHYLASKEAGNAPQERIYAVHESVVLLNKIFVQHLSEAGLPAASFVPSEHIQSKNGKLVEFDISEVEDLLSINSVPVVFGDIVDDGTEKGIIYSTETLFELIAEKLRSRYVLTILYTGDTDGVLDPNMKTIPEISLQTWEDMGSSVASPNGYDVTGGMTHKIESALRMAQIATHVRILSGKTADTIVGALEGRPVGTKVVR